MEANKYHSKMAAGRIRTKCTESDQNSIEIHNSRRRTGCKSRLQRFFYRSSLVLEVSQLWFVTLSVRNRFKTENAVLVGLVHQAIREIGLSPLRSSATFINSDQIPRCPSFCSESGLTVSIQQEPVERLHRKVRKCLLSHIFYQNENTGFYYWPVAKSVLWHTLCCNAPSPSEKGRLLQHTNHELMLLWYNKIIHLYRIKKRRESGTIRTANPVTCTPDCQLLVESPTPFGSFLWLAGMYTVFTAALRKCPPCRARFRW